MRAVFTRANVTSALTGLAFVLAATALLLLLQAETPDWFNLPIVVLLYLAAITFATQLGGFKSGLLAAVAAFLCFNYFFIDPRGTLLVTHLTDLAILPIFLIVAVLNTRVIGAAQRSRIEAEQRERDATRFYELSLALISTRELGDIANTLTSRLRDILHADGVEVQLMGADETAPIRARAPAETPSAPPLRVEPIQSARGNLGQVRVWRTAPLSPGEERLLRTFAAEAALVLERQRSSLAETRAKVLEESDRMKTALLGSVSHELRTPLATIRAGAESLRSGLVAPDSAAGRELLQDVDDAATYLSKLVNNLLDMTRIESGALTPQREWIDLVEVISGAAARLRKDIHQHPLVVDAADELPLVPADPVQLDQVFTNLISNSAKYAPSGTPIAIHAEKRQPDTMLVTVSNDSPPLPAEDLQRIFDKFYRVTNADRVMGTGLGLSICKGIVEAHGGTITAQNKPGGQRGVVFTFTLPLTWNGVAPRLPPPE